jgi:preprotein translocase subunit SecG
MIILITIVHVIVSLFLIGVVLLQSGKAADLAGAFGGLGSQTVFGPRGSATVLTRATSISAILFMVTSLSLSLVATSDSVGGGSGGGILDQITAPVQETGQPAAPVAPGTPGTPGSIQVTPEINGAPGETQSVPLPIAPAPTKAK